MQMLDTAQDTQQGVTLDSKESAEACHNETEIIPVRQAQGTQLRTAVPSRYRRRPVARTCWATFQAAMVTFALLLIH